MSDFPVNNQNDDIKEDIKEENASEDVKASPEEEFSTIFSDSTEHRKKSAGVPRKKRLLAVISSILAVAVLVGGTVAVIKLIPKKEDGTTSSQQDTISILDVDVKTISAVTVKNSKGTFKFIPTHTEQKPKDDTQKPTVNTTWSVDGTDSKYTNSSLIASKVAAAAELSAIDEITGRNADECGFKSPLSTITITTDKDKEYVIEIGAKSADGLGNYVRVLGTDKIYLADASLFNEFEFELLDLAATTAIPGIAITDDMKDYTNQGQLIKFDNLTISGKNFPKPLVISASGDDSALSQYFAYVITSPEERVADKVDTVFNMFTSGLKVAGAYAFDVSPESLKKVGLDKPHITATIKIGKYTQTYKIAKVDEEYCAVVTDNSYMIHKVAASDISFLDFNAENFYSSMVFLKSIDTLSNMTLEVGGKSYSFDIKVEEKDDQKEYIIHHNGQKLVAEYFQNFYQHFVGVTYTDYKRDVNVSDVEMKVTVKFNDGHTETVEYAKDTATRYACIINGKVMGRVSSTDYNRLVKDIANVSQNKDVA